MSSYGLVMFYFTALILYINFTLLSIPLLSPVKELYFSDTEEVAFIRSITS